MSSSSSSSSSLNVISKCTVIPDQKSTLGDLKLSVSDLPMLSCHYIQKGCLFSLSRDLRIDSIIALLKHRLSQTLSLFPPLAGRLVSDSDGYVYIACNDYGIDFIHANSLTHFIRDILSPTDVPHCFKEFFALDRTVSYDGHFKPLMAVQVTELADGVFVGCTANHAIVDGTSFWHFFNTFAELCRDTNRIARSPDFSRDSVLVSQVPLRLPKSGPQVNFSNNVPLRERIFSFSRRAMLELKEKTKRKTLTETYDPTAVEIMGKLSNDIYFGNDGKTTLTTNQTTEISSFQSLCAFLWRSVTRARKLPPTKTTTFRMAVNCRHRLEPKLEPFYFGNAIQSAPTYALAGEVMSNEPRWCAEQLNKTIVGQDKYTVRRNVEDWENDPKLFPLGNLDGASITMGSSHRFPMYDNDFGWGRPVAVRSGGANKFDGKISAFPGREGGGSVDLEVVLATETMAAIESDLEFMQYVNV